MFTKRESKPKPITITEKMNYFRFDYLVFWLFLDFVGFFFVLWPKRIFYKIGPTFKVSSSSVYTFNTICTIFSHKIRVTNIKNINQTKN